MYMFLGLTWEKILLLLVIAAFLIGPERLPRYAEGLAGLVKRGRDMLKGARERMRDEMGPEFDDVDWRKLDPRQYDPRRIIRDALFEEPSFDAKPTPAPSAAAAPAPTEALGAASRPAWTRSSFSRSTPPPFDAEAT